MSHSSLPLGPYLWSSGANLISGIILVPEVFHDLKGDTFAGESKTPLLYEERPVLT